MSRSPPHSPSPDGCPAIPAVLEGKSALGWLAAGIASRMQTLNISMEPARCV